jgi:hypothetical protein
MMKPSEEQIGVAAPVDRIVRDGNVAEKLNEYHSVEDRLKRIERWIDREEEWHDKLDAVSEVNNENPQAASQVERLVRPNLDVAKIPRVLVLDQVFTTPVHVQVFLKDGKFDGYSIANVSVKQPCFQTRKIGSEEFTFRPEDYSNDSEH